MFPADLEPARPHAARDAGRVGGGPDPEESEEAMSEDRNEWVPDPRWKVTLAGGECSFPRCEGEA